MLLQQLMTVPTDQLLRIKGMIQVELNRRADAQWRQIVRSPRTVI